MKTTGKTYEPIPGNKWEYGESFQNSTYHWDIKHWLGPCPICGGRTFDYGGGYSCVERHCAKSSQVFAYSAGDMPTWWNTNVSIEKDGNAWCAYYDDNFINIQESPCGFGERPMAAVAQLLSEHPTGEEVKG